MFTTAKRSFIFTKTLFQREHKIKNVDLKGLSCNMFKFSTVVNIILDISVNSQCQFRMLETKQTDAEAECLNECVCGHACVLVCE